MKYLFCTALVLFFKLTSFSQQWQWARSYGGNGNDSTVDIKIRDGFLYVTGVYSSPEIKWENTLLKNKGGKDIFVAKLDTNGKTIWVKSYGAIGDDLVEQLEVNKSGTITLRCKSTSTALKAGNFLLNSPSEFFIGIDKDGNEVNAVSLPTTAKSTDIVLDCLGATYVAVQYKQAFNFKDSLIDTLYSYAGAALLKYDAQGKPEWYKNVQVCDNHRFLGHYYKNDPLTPPGPGDVVYYYYPAAEVNQAYASFQIAYNEFDDIIGVNCVYDISILFPKTIPAAANLYEYFYFDEHAYPKEGNFQFNIKRNGDIKLARFNDNYRSVNDEFAADNGVFLDFASWAPKSFSARYSHNMISQVYHVSIEIAEKDSVLKSKSWLRLNSYELSSRDHIIPESMRISRKGEFISMLFTSDSLKFFDSSLNIFKSIVIPQRKRLANNIFNYTYYNGNDYYYDQAHDINSCFYDTTSLYIGSIFSDSALILNDSLVSGTKILNNHGGKDVFIGKLSLTDKHIINQSQNVSICKRSSFTFPDDSSFDNILTDTSYTSNLTSIYGEDSIVTMSIALTAIDTSIMQDRNTLTATNNNPASYQWINSNNGSAIIGENAQTFTSNKTGNFAVAISVNGCIDTSSTYIITLDNLPIHRNYILYPVPAGNDITLEINVVENIAATLLIIDLSGKPVISKKVSLTNGDNKIIQSVRALSKGVYTLILQGNESKKLISKKIIKL